VGFFFRHQIEGTLTKSIPVIIGSLVGLAALLWFAEKIARHERTISQVGWLDAIIVGCAQALALIPGSSRSGTRSPQLFLRFASSCCAILLPPGRAGIVAGGVFGDCTKSPAWCRRDRMSFAGIPSRSCSLVRDLWVCGDSVASQVLIKHTMMVFVWYRIALGSL
jgi:hypothetical protein